MVKLALVLAGCSMAAYIVFRGLAGWYSGWGTIPTLAHLVAGPALLVVAVWVAILIRR